MSLKFTVILPTYNRPHWVERAIASVCAQDYTHWELCIVDDGSEPAYTLPDALHDPRIRLIRQANEGPSAARRRGIASATGEVLCFLDDDDRYLPDHLRVLAALYSGDQTVYCTGMYTERLGIRRRDELLPSGQILPIYWNRPRNLLSFGIPAAIARVYPFPLHTSPIEDFEWLVTLLAHCALVSAPRFTTVYSLHTTNRSSTLTARDWLYAREQVVHRLADQPAVRGYLTSSMIHRQLTHQRLHWTRQCLRTGQWEDARWGLRRAFRQAGPASGKEFAYTLLTGVRTLFRYMRSRPPGGNPTPP